MADDIVRSTMFVDDERGGLAMDATFEIEHLCKTIVDQVNAYPRAEFLAFRGIAMRISQLNYTIMSAVGDEGATNEEIRQDIYGEKLAYNPCEE